MGCGVVVVVVVVSLVGRDEASAAFHCMGMKGRVEMEDAGALGDQL